MFGLPCAFAVICSPGTHWFGGCIWNAGCEVVTYTGSTQAACKPSAVAVVIFWAMLPLCKGVKAEDSRLLVLVAAPATCGDGANVPLLQCACLGFEDGQVSHSAPLQLLLFGVYRQLLPSSQVVAVTLLCSLPQIRATATRARAAAAAAAVAWSCRRVQAQPHMYRIMCGGVAFWQSL
ncbi:hypothetical protein COO60DRAFT_1698900 [Scenedesmus sp. NREL 46B-D3]|nr:hypothetical protein COO60DRAFT_1698900 [Scenedesmus sp. NREL 46B-D3]